MNCPADYTGQIEAVDDAVADCVLEAMSLCCCAADMGHTTAQLHQVFESGWTKNCPLVGQEETHTDSRCLRLWMDLQTADRKQDVLAVAWTGSSVPVRALVPSCARVSAAEAEAAVAADTADFVVFVAAAGTDGYVLVVVAVVLALVLVAVAVAAVVFASVRTALAPGSAADAGSPVTLHPAQTFAMSLLLLLYLRLHCAHPRRTMREMKVAMTVRSQHA